MPQQPSPRSRVAFLNEPLLGIAAEHELPSSRAAEPSRSSTFRWCLKRHTSLAMVSIRTTMQVLSCILIEGSPRAILHADFSIR